MPQRHITYLSSQSFSPDFEKVSEDIKMGPQREVLQLIEDFNYTYTQRSWMYGNRSQLDILPKIGCTKTFRWKPGSQETIKKVLKDRVWQLHKKGSMHTMFNRIQHHHFERVRSKVLKINDKLELLRLTNDEWFDNTDFIKSTYEQLIINLDKEINTTNVILETSPIDAKFSWKFIHPDLSDRENKVFLNSSDMFKGASIQILYKWNNPNINVTKRTDGGMSETLGSIDTAPIVLAYEISLYSLINAKVKLEHDNTIRARQNSLNHSDVNYSDRNRFNELIGERNFGVVCRGMLLNEQGNLNSTYGLRFPFIGSHESSWQLPVPVENPNNNDENESSARTSLATSVYTDYLNRLRMMSIRKESTYKGKTFTSVCYGSGESDVKQLIINFNFTELATYLINWLNYDYPRTSPLANLQECFYGLPSDWNEEMRLIVGQSPRRCGNKMQQDLSLDYFGFIVDYLHDDHGDEVDNLHRNWDRVWNKDLQALPIDHTVNHENINHQEAQDSIKKNKYEFANIFTNKCLEVNCSLKDACQYFKFFSNNEPREYSEVYDVPDENDIDPVDYFLDSLEDNQNEPFSLDDTIDSIADEDNLSMEDRMIAWAYRNNGSRNENE